MSTDSPVRPRPAVFRALGRAEPPEQIAIAGRFFQHEELLKHDSWAATAIYSSRGQRIICKFHRIQPIFGVPMAWLGRRLAARERRFLARLADVPNVPSVLGPVTVNGQVLTHAAARRYIPGHPLSPGDVVDDEFFSELRFVLQEMHGRGIAYVDLHKRENILVGENGRPYLFDFQISVDAQRRLWRCLPGSSWFFRILCQSDLYHLEKHIIRQQAGTDPDAEARLARLRPWWIRIHRLIARPLREVRRKLLVFLNIRSGRGLVSSEYFAEHAIRQIRARRTSAQ